MVSLDFSFSYKVILCLSLGNVGKNALRMPILYGIILQKTGNTIQVLYVKE